MSPTLRSAYSLNLIERRTYEEALKERRRDYGGLIQDLEDYRDLFGFSAFIFGIGLGLLPPSKRRTD
jgi:hypothetical protein